MVKREFRKRAEVLDNERIWRMAANKERISRADAAALIASKIDKKPGDDEQTRRNRVQSAIGTDIRKGALPDPGESGFGVAEIIEWARNHFDENPAAFDGLPRAITLLGEHGVVTTSVGDSVGIHGVVLPATVAECHQRIQEKDAEIARLMKVERELRRQIAEMEPFVEKWRHYMATRHRRIPAA